MLLTSWLSWLYLLSCLKSDLAQSPIQVALFIVLLDVWLEDSARDCARTLSRHGGVSQAGIKKQRSLRSCFGGAEMSAAKEEEVVPDYPGGSSTVALSPCPSRPAFELCCHQDFLEYNSVRFGPGHWPARGFGLPSWASRTTRSP